MFERLHAKGTRWFVTVAAAATMATASAILSGCNATVLPSAQGASSAAAGPAAIANQNQRQYRLDIAPRYQWEHNYGYCGEVSFISAGLYYGQYISQYDARAAATNAPQYAYRSQLLLGGTDMRAARNMHLAATEWNRKTEKSSQEFLAWVKENVMQGYPVVIGIYTNDYRFYGNRNPQAGSPEYDHIVPILSIDARKSGNGYDPGDRIAFSDNGLLGSGPDRSRYVFSYPFGSFQRSRKQADGPHAPWYSLPDYGQNYGAVVTGVRDDDHETLPVRITTSANDEQPQIAKHSDTRPPADPLTLTVTISGLQPGQNYVLYRYDSLQAIPDSAFNANASQASEHWNVTGTSSGTYAVTEKIMTDDVAAYRAVPENAP